MPHVIHSYKDVLLIIKGVLIQHYHVHSTMVLRYNVLNSMLIMVLNHVGIPMMPLNPHNVLIEHVHYIQ